MFKGNRGDELAVEARVIKKAGNEQLGLDLLDLSEVCAGFCERNCWVLCYSSERAHDNIEIRINGFRRGILPAFSGEDWFAEKLLHFSPS